MAPSASNLATAVAVMGAWKLSSIWEAAVVFPVRLRKLSFSAKGTPASLPTDSPLAIFLSMSAARCRAASALRDMKQWYSSYFLALSRAALTRSTALVDLFAIFIV